MVKPRIDFEVLKSASDLEVFDVRVFGTDQNGNEFSRVLSFDVPVSIEKVQETIALFESGRLRKLPNR